MFAHKNHRSITPENERPRNTQSASVVAPVSSIRVSLWELMSVAYIGISYGHALQVSDIGISQLSLRWIHTDMIYQYEIRLMVGRTIFVYRERDRERDR